MATTPGFAEDMATSVLGIYERVELLLLEKIAELVKKGIDAPDWMTMQLTEIQRYRQFAAGLLNRVNGEATPEMLRIIETAAQFGDAAALRELGDLINPGAGSLAFSTQGVAALAQEASLAVAATHFQILRSSEDIFRDVIGEVINAPLLGVETRQQAASRALRRFAQEGIKVYTGASGRAWSMTSYVEMSTRSSLMNAALQGHAQRLERHGFNLVVVSDHAQECKLCRPYEGKILSLDGATGTVEMENPRTGRMNRVRIYATLREARGRGLFHPNCRHSYSAYLPGVTRSFGPTADPQGDKDRQKLRRLERDVRALKRAQAVALTDDEKKAIGAKIRAKQAAIRHHVNTTTAKRQPARERITGNFS